MSVREQLQTFGQSIVGNFGYKLASLVMAVLLWSWVQNEQVVEDRVRVRLDWKLPDGLVAAEPLLQSATVTVSGVQASVRAVRQKPLSLPLDLSKNSEGEVEVKLAERTVLGLPAQVRLLNVAPETIEVNLVRLVKRRVDVAVALKGSVAPGYRIVSAVVEPDRVEISGPSTAFKNLSSIYTDKIDVSDLKEDTEFDTSVDLRRGVLQLSGPQRLVVKVDVEAVNDQRTLDAIPVVIEGDAYTTSVATVQVVVSGPATLLSELRTEEMGVIVSVPEGFDAPTAEAQLDAAEGPRFRVVLPGREGLRVVAVTPSTLPIEKK